MHLVPIRGAVFVLDVAERPTTCIQMSRDCACWSYLDHNGTTPTRGSCGSLQPDTLEMFAHGFAGGFRALGVARGKDFEDCGPVRRYVRFRCAFTGQTQLLEEKISEDGRHI